MDTFGSPTPNTPLIKSTRTGLEAEGDPSLPLTVTTSTHAWYSKKRYVSVAVAIAMELSAGTLYGFSVFGPGIKERMGYSQTQLNFIGAAGNFGVYALAIPMGFFFDAFGPRVTALGAASLLFGAYTTLASLLAVTTDSQEAPPAWVFGALLLLVGLGSGSSYFSATLPNVRNFPPSRRGRISGVLVGCFGLSAALYTTVYRKFFEASDESSTDVDDIAGYMAFTAVTAGVANLLGGLFITQLPAQWSQSPESLKKEPPVDGTFPPIEAASVGVGRGTDVTGWQLVGTIEFRMLVFTVFVLAGPSLMFINNVGNFVESLGGSGDDKAAMVTIYSIFNWLGRLCMGFISDLTLSNVGRMFWIALCCIIMCSVSAVLAIGVNSLAGVKLASMAAGIAYGGKSALLPAAVSEFFGLRHLGFNLGMAALSIAGGSAVFGLIGGLVYDTHVSPGQKSCFGEHCFQEAFWVNCTASLMGIIVAFMLESRWRAGNPAAAKSAAKSAI